MLHNARGHVRSPGTWWARQDRTAFVVRGTAGSSIALVVALALGSATPVMADDLDDRKSALENEIEDLWYCQGHVEVKVALV